MHEKVYVRCIVFPGAFSGERDFEIRPVSGDSFRGVAPARYIRGTTKVVANGVDGFVAARVLDRVGEAVTVRVPSDAVVTVRVAQVQSRTEAPAT